MDASSNNQEETTNSGNNNNLDNIHDENTIHYSSRWKTSPEDPFHSYLVHPAAQVRHVAAAPKILPQDHEANVQGMKTRILYMIQLHQGHLDPRHFVYGKRKEHLRQLFIAALSTWNTNSTTPRLIVRQVTLPLRELTAPQARLLAQVFLSQGKCLLRSIELDGNNRIVAADIWEAILPGLAAVSVQTLILRGLVLSQRHHHSVADPLQHAIMRWMVTLQHIELVDCLPGAYHVVSQAISSALAASATTSIPLQSVTLDGPLEQDVQAAHAAATLLTSIPHLASVTFTRHCNLATLLPFLPMALPWSTIRLPTATTHKRPPHPYNTVEHLVGLIQRSAAYLQHLQIFLPPLHVTTPQDLQLWSDALHRLRNLTSLSLYGYPPGPVPNPTSNVEWILSCPPSLQRLECHNILQGESLLFNGQHEHLQSLHLSWSNRQDWLRIWQVLLDSSTHQDQHDTATATEHRALQEIVLQKYSDDLEDDDNDNGDDDDNHNPANMLFFCEPFQRTLLTSTTLTSLTLKDVHPNDMAVMDVLANALGNNECILQNLCLEGIRHDLGNLWQALATNTTLTSLKLGFAYHSFAAQSWERIVQLIPHIAHVTCLTLDVGSNGVANRSLDIDDLALALDKNSNLVSMQVFNAGDFQPKFDFVCRLYSRRNCIEQILHQGKMPMALWPCVLESMIPNPSAIFALAKRIPFPSVGDSRHHHHYALDDEAMIDRSRKLRSHP